MGQNICHFIPYHNDLHSIHTIHFVLETNQQNYKGMRSESVYKIHYVCSGTGKIHTVGKTTTLQEGDLFFTFPSASYAIESIDGFSYMYISFVGLRGNRIMENLKINSNHFLFHHANEVQPFWEKGLSANSVILDLMSESVLLYTFSYLGNQLLPENRTPTQHNTIDLIKKYVDDHFTEPHFSLENMSRELSYNKKYLSSLFKKEIGVGIIEYLTTIRIQNACTMIEQGFTSVNDIADRCGYTDAQYFSKLFKSKIGVVPTQYIKMQTTR